MGKVNYDNYVSDSSLRKYYDQFQQQWADIQLEALYQDHIYSEWKKENHIDSLKSLHEWFSDSSHTHNLTNPFMEERRYCCRYIREMPVNRNSVNEILVFLNTIETFLIYQSLLNRFSEFLTEEEIAKIENKKYAIWKKEFNIIDFKSFCDWYSEETFLGNFSLNSNSEIPETYIYLQKLLSELPVSREIAEQIMECSTEIDAYDEVTGALLTRFKNVLSDREIEYYSAD